MKRAIYYSLDKKSVSDNDYLLKKFPEIVKITFNPAFNSQQCINLEKELFTKAKHNLLLEIFLSIAVSEAQGVDELYLSISKEKLNNFVKDSTEFLNVLKRIVYSSTKNKLKIHVLNEEDSVEKVTISEENNITSVLLKNNVKTVVVYSGGLDCTVAAHSLQSQEIPFELSFIDYGQNNLIEEKLCLEKQSSQLGISKKNSIKVINCLKNFYYQMNDSIDLINGEKITIKNSEAEYVPSRNILLIIITALNFDLSKELQIITGSHEDDKNSPDNSIEFYFLLNRLFKSTRIMDNITVNPMLYSIGGKKDIVDLGNKLGVNFSWTWTCHNKSQNKNKLVPCLECNDCLVRQEAFFSNDLIDPFEKALDFNQKYGNIRNIIKNEFRFENDNFEDMTFEELNIDSLKFIYIVTIIENEYNFEFDMSEIVKFEECLISNFIDSAIKSIEINFLQNKK
ncbi:7-cyano-7-deazaguanine synthase [Enterococcus sp. ALS3]|uniref:7-cyano-7-deazaguanine synthase n=1 Tax=Enterococcus alishanensis TaxID=1303817 RepID=A0ABS6THM6_9ENTE|nr:7-cyano-7-deazaguanine synthase [Enterococcus alishanensis]MBV7392477.1 7-cyano-7-deazaguanine synthase [Enterococcus alishanensis]